jgi:hypothetical protein
MAAMSTVLTEFADNGNSRTYTQAGHTVEEPELVLQKRKVPTGSAVIAEDVVTTLSHTEDSEGVTLPQRVSISTIIRRPINGDAADVAAQLVIHRDIIAGDEFTNTVNTQEWLI